MSIIVRSTEHEMFKRSIEIIKNNSKQLVFDIYVDCEYKRTFVNDVQINEFIKRLWNKDKFAKIGIVPVERNYVEC